MCVCVTANMGEQFHLPGTSADRPLNDRPPLPPQGRTRQGTREFVFTAADGILIRTILAICITITRPPLGDAVAIVALEVGGLTRVIDRCQQKRGSNPFCAPSPVTYQKKVLH